MAANGIIAIKALAIMSSVKWTYLSGSEKRKAKKKRIENEKKGRQTLEECGWFACRSSPATQPTKSHSLTEEDISTVHISGMSALSSSDA